MLACGLGCSSQAEISKGGFEVIPTELRKACPEVSGIHLGYRVLIIFLKCLIYVIQNLFLLTPEVTAHSTQNKRSLNSISVLSTVNFVCSRQQKGNKIRINFLMVGFIKGESVSLFLHAEVPDHIPMTRSLEKFDFISTLSAF